MDCESTDLSLNAFHKALLVFHFLTQHPEIKEILLDCMEERIGLLGRRLEA